MEVSIGEKLFLTANEDGACLEFIEGIYEVCGKGGKRDKTCVG